MKILTWNIIASEWAKQSYPTLKTPSLLDPHRRIQIIMRRIQEMHADIVLLQEVMEQEYETLCEQFHQDYHCSSLRIIPWTKTKTSSGNVTFLKKTLFTQGDEWAMEYGIYVKSGGIAIVNLHLDDLSSLKRRKQMSELRPILEKEVHAVIGGDFNQEYKKDAVLYKLSNFKVHNTCDTYFVEKDMNLDNILTKGFTATAPSCSYIPQSVEEGLYGSDHIPVTTTVY